MAEGTILLNACHTVLSPIDWRDAVRLILAGKAEAVVVDEDRPIRSQNFSMPFPKIVRLIRYIWVKALNPACTRKAILERDNKRCIYCAGSGSTIEHIIPKSRGGQWTFENLACCCVACNGRKGNSLLKECGMTLLWNPTTPKRYEDLQKEVWALL